MAVAVAVAARLAVSNAIVVVVVVVLSRELRRVTNRTGARTAGVSEEDRMPPGARCALREDWGGEGRGAEGGAQGRLYRTCMADLIPGQEAILQAYRSGRRD